MIVAEHIAYDDFIKTCRHLYIPHYREVPYAGNNLQQDIDHDMYRQMEENGALHITVVREGSYAIAYMAVVVEVMAHHKDKYRAVTDTFYVLPNKRGMGAMQAMTDLVEVGCRIAGIHSVQLVTNANFKDAEGVARSLGYTILETTWVKEL